MYYDINRIISEEIKGIDMLLAALEEYSDEDLKGSLFVRTTSKGNVYHLKEKIQKGKYRSVRLGDERDPEVIRYKQSRFKSRDKHMVIVALEHLGKLTDERYFENAMHKFRLYIKNGYRLNDTLLLTADDANGKIDSYSIVRMLKARFEIDF